MKTNKFEELGDCIDRLLKFFQKYNDAAWAHVFSQLRVDFEECVGKEQRCVGQPILINKLNKLFGGMGSLNDVYICEESGHLVDDEIGANKELDQLRNKLYAIYKLFT